NTCGVKSWHPVPLDLLSEQLHAVITDIRPEAVKTGMVPSAAHIRVIADTIRSHSLCNLVVDPVAVATSGDSLTAADTMQAAVAELFPLATIVTPNLPEASMMLGAEVNETNAVDAAQAIISRFGPQAVLIKGGHGKDDTLTDTLVTRHSGAVATFSHPRILTPNTHGTGCSLSSAIASLLAMGAPLPRAVEAAIRFVHEAIVAGAAFQIGHGHGAIDHLYRIKPFSYGN
ncbi:MAG: bifunctional hydroxymethylpyrimidine kinase/phosphomethylpyrimidine kinase, partial [Muribaculaceae bacterium]|nr:bifunctional hydroxymethylpyrimidine kinase/phosphomethylpyrimidine kinase [Muribaculaceae bacterium]